ncbi:beta strand repeat-containing protein [Chelativorans sp. YIM 93263]|uniref:beta strand repeat-containing protein n=1 Tax=Chelativorans sp. YIM 93263 TaxID=2906648 RepID=UPI0023791568|nr:IPT/TIG domain-containing protein [Chelativorans sp. YIM 93263]
MLSQAKSNPLKDFVTALGAVLTALTVALAFPQEAMTQSAAPTISGISPANGTTEGGTSVTITGTNLTGASAPTFGGAKATSYTVDSDTQITAVTPAHVSGAVDVAVITSSGSETLSGGFTYVAPVTLSIADVTVSEGDDFTGATFTVSLSQAAGAGGVTFDIATADGTASDGSNYSASSLTGLSIPAGSSLYSFTVQVIGDTISEADETFFANVTNVSGATVSDGQGAATIRDDDPLPQLFITRTGGIEGNTGTSSRVFEVTLTPASGQPVSASFATVDGTASAGSDYVANSGTINFAPGSTSAEITVTINGDLTIEPDENFTVELSDAVGATLTMDGVGTILNDDFPAPMITDIAPATGTTAGGTTVTITGTELTGATAVTFGGTAANSFTVDSATQITATTPARAAGAADVVVTTPGGSATATGGFTYEVPAPTLSSINPNAGPGAGGTTVTIAGTGLTGATAISFGGTPATSFTVDSATQITATTPAHATGTVDVTVTTPGGSDTLTDAFAFVAPPTITGIAPTAGSSVGRTHVIITGADLAGATVVTFGSTAARFIQEGPAQISATADPHPAGAVDVTVTTPGGSDTLTGGFTYVEPSSAPIVSNVSGPADGTYKAGDILTFTVTYDQNVGVRGSPSLSLELRGAARSASYAAGDASNKLTFSYVVQSGDLAPSGIGLGPSISLNGGSIYNGARTDANLTLNGVPDLSSVLIDAVAPTVVSTAFSGSPAPDATAVDFVVTFSEPVTGVDSSDFTLATTGSATGSISATSTSDNVTYNVSVNAISGIGTLRLDVLADSIVDAIGNPLAADFSSGTPWTRGSSTNA